MSGQQIPGTHLQIVRRVRSYLTTTKPLNRWSVTSVSRKPDCRAEIRMPIQTLVAIALARTAPTEPLEFPNIKMKLWQSPNVAIQVRFFCHFAGTTVLRRVPPRMLPH